MWVGMQAVTALVAAQELPTSRPQAPAPVVKIEYAQWQIEGDAVVWLVTPGIRFVTGTTEIRADHAVLVQDVDGRSQLLGESQREAALPRRSVPLPTPRRELDEKVLRARLDGFLRSVQRGRPPQAAGRTQVSGVDLDPFLQQLRSVYLEGNVIVVQNGVETARCRRLYFSLLDDRAIFEDVELRFASPDNRGNERLVVVRAPRLVRQGLRTLGRDLSITTCTAGEPHVELLSGEAEILERGDQLEIRTRGNHLAFSGVRLLPLPSYSFFTGEQSEIPIKGASAGYSSKEGMQAGLIFGTTWNRLGGSLHQAITGRDASEFRGDWELGVGWIEKRGYPVKGTVEYRAEGLYRGRTDGFVLDDSGENIRSIRNYYDGRPVTTSQRDLVRSENRFHLSPTTDLDLKLHQGSDPAVFSEFFERRYYEDEPPESSVYLRSAADNRLFTTKARFNLDGWSYTDAKALAPGFREELPLATYDLFSQPLGELPTGTPLLLTSSTSAGYLRTDWDATNPTQSDDDTFRVDQEFQLATPFTWGPVGLRPFAGARATYYDETNVQETDTRLAFEAGVQAGTRFMRTWSWLDADGERKAIRHVISPTITWVDRWRVDGNPVDYRQFDATDSLDETNEIRFDILNRFQKMRKLSDPRTKQTLTEAHDFLWLDLAQTVLPNEPDHLGLFEYELLIRTDFEWALLPRPEFLVEGEYDWNRRKYRTANYGVSFGPVIGIDWRAEYRTDETSRGELHYGASTRFFGRWLAGGGSIYDFDQHQVSSYVADLVRVDHDWRIVLRLGYDTIGEETSLSINFEPTLGGLVKQRESRLLAGSRLYGGGGASEW